MIGMVDSTTSQPHGRKSIQSRLSHTYHQHQHGVVISRENGVFPCQSKRCWPVRVLRNKRSSLASFIENPSTYPERLRPYPTHTGAPHHEVSIPRPTPPPINPSGVGGFTFYPPMTQVPRPQPIPFNNVLCSKWAYLSRCTIINRTTS